MASAPKSKRSCRAQRGPMIAPSPKGMRPIARGWCEATSTYPGNTLPQFPNPNVGCVHVSPCIPSRRNPGWGWSVFCRPFPWYRRRATMGFGTESLWDSWRKKTNSCPLHYMSDRLPATHETRIAWWFKERRRSLRSSFGGFVGRNDFGGGGGGAGHQ